MAEGQDKLPQKAAILSPLTKKKQPNLRIVRRFGNAIVKSAAQPIVSLKTVKFDRETGGKLISFAVKVTAVEIVRRLTQNRCPPIWTAIQSLPLLQYPPFSWFQHLVPFNYLFLGSQVFSKPVVCLSIATTFSSKLQELTSTEEPVSSGVQTFQNDSAVSDTGAIMPLPILPTCAERDDDHQNMSDHVSDPLTLLKQELQKSGVTLPDRIGDDELRRFLIAANDDLTKCAALVKKTVRWRQTFYFIPPYELESWSSLVFWHGCDAQMRPSLVIRIGCAYSVLKASERPRFVQAILSQVEYGVTHLVCDEDPRITVIIDCERTPALGFPVSMLKSCCVRMQENYPTRLAALFIVNLPPVVRVIAQAVIQVLRPSTKKKIHIPGEKYIQALAEHFGGCDDIPNFLGGSCSCSNCEKIAPPATTAHLQLLDKEDQTQHNYDSSDDTDVDQDDSTEEDISTYSRYHSMLRAIIIAFLMLWVIVCLLAGFLDLEGEQTPP